MAETFGHLMLNACQRYGPRVALTGRGESRSYGDLLARGSRFANALRGLGLGAGTHVAAMLEDTVTAFEVYVGCAIGGYPLVHVNDRLAAPEVSYIVSDSSAKVLVHTAGRSATVDAVDATSELRAVVTIGAEDGPRPKGAMDYETLLATASAVPPAQDRDPDDLAILGYTSGTTGFPKGVMASNRALVDCIKLIPFAYRMPMYGRVAYTGSLSFISAVWGVILPHIYTGGRVDFLNPYTVDSWIDHVIKERSTFTYAPSPLVPGFIEQVRKRPEALDSLQSVLHSASPLPRAHTVDLVELIGDRYVEVWGMTESVGPLTVTGREDWRGPCTAEDIHTSVGRPLATASVRVVDPAGSTLPVGETGELAIRADTMFSGYWGKPDKTAEVLHDGEYSTGDAGRLDEAGYVYVTGRMKELIISGGMNVYPAEVEAALTTLSGVADVSCFGVPHDRWGETVAVAIVRRPGADLTEEAVIDHARSRLASYKKPTAVLFLDELPRNAGLKVEKPKLRQLYLEQP